MQASISEGRISCTTARLPGHVVLLCLRHKGLDTRILVSYRVASYMEL